MGNMDYCRFRNTLGDLKDCYGHLDDDLEGNKEEARARVKLYDLCEKIVSEGDWDLYVLEAERAIGKD